MFLHFLKIGFRHHRAEKGYSFISIAGLCLGFTSALVLAVFILNEFSYDRFHADSERIYRITSTYVSGSSETHYAINEGYWDRLVEENVPGVEASTAFYTYKGDEAFRTETQTANGGIALVADTDFFRVFSFPMLFGDPQTALHQPASIVLSRELAEKLWGTANVVGRTLERLHPDSTHRYVVSAVLDDIPSNSSIRFDYVIAGSGSFWDQATSTRGVGNTMHIFFKLDKAAAPERVQEIVRSAIDTSPSGQIVADLRLNVQALHDVYLNATAFFEIVAGGNPDQLRIYMWVCAAIVFISMVNFVNLNTSSTLRRAKEIGVRKLLGTHRKTLMGQLLTESLLLTLAALFLAMLASHIIVSDFLSGRLAIHTEQLYTPWFLGGILAVGLIIGVLAGIYPALKLSAMPGINALKGKITLERDRLWSPRNVLVTLQLAVAALMLVFSIAVSRQVDYIQSKDAGYRTDHVLVLVKPTAVDDHQWGLFREGLESIPGITATGSSTHEIPGNMSTLSVPAKGGQGYHTVNWNSVDASFFETLSMAFTAGGPFHDESDFDAVVLNQAASIKLELDDPVGQIISWYGRSLHIVGVVKDFHHKPFTSAIEPVMFFRGNPFTDGPSSPNFVYVHTQAGFSELRTALDALWAGIGAPVPYTYRFLDETYALLMAKEARTNDILKAFTSIILLITGIGLLGLIGHSVNRRRKEIALRKILGANVTQMAALMTQRFLLLTLAAFVMAIVPSIWVVDEWLKSFAYRISLGWADFGLALLAIAVFTAAVVAFKALSAALASPLGIIREE